MKITSLITAVGCIALCSGVFASKAPTQPANDWNGEYVGGSDWDAADNTSSDMTSSDAAYEVTRAFATDNGKDPKGQAKLDALLASFGYDAGTLTYGKDNLKSQDDDDKKMKSKKHKHHHKHHKPPKSPHK